MFPNEKEDPTLKRLEADLAALVPRRAGVEPDWAAALAETAPCSSANHVFACVYCGAAADTSSSSRRWAWPAAFSAVATVAAVLLALLLARHESLIAAGGSPRGALPVTEVGATAGLPEDVREFQAVGGDSCRRFERGEEGRRQKTPPTRAFATPCATAGLRRAQSSRLPSSAAPTGGQAARGTLTPLAASDPKVFETLLASNSGPWPSDEATASGSIEPDEEPLSAGTRLRAGWMGRGDLDELIRGVKNPGKPHSAGADL